MQSAAKPTYANFDKALWSEYKELKDSIANIKNPDRGAQNAERYLAAVAKLKAMNANPYEYKMLLKPVKYQIAHLLKHIPMEHFLKEQGWGNWVALKHFMVGKRAHHKGRRARFGISAKRWKGYRGGSHGPGLRRQWKSQQHRKYYGRRGKSYSAPYVVGRYRRPWRRFPRYSMY